MQKSKEGNTKPFVAYDLIKFVFQSRVESMKPVCGLKKKQPKIRNEDNRKYIFSVIYLTKYAPPTLPNTHRRRHHCPQFSLETTPKFYKKIPHLIFICCENKERKRKRKSERCDFKHSFWRRVKTRHVQHHRHRLASPQDWETIYIVNMKAKIPVENKYNVSVGINKNIRNQNKSSQTVELDKQ